MQLLPQATLDQYWALFDSTIKNGKRDGQMDLKELNKAMGELGQPEEERTDEKLQAMIDKYDLNGDGTLSYDEFLIMMNWGPLVPEKPAAPAPAAPAAPAPTPAAGGDGSAPAPKSAPAPAADAGKKATDCQKMADAAAVCKKNKEQKEAEDEAKKEEEKTKEEDKAKKEADKTK